MTELNSAVFIITAEALAAMILLAIGLFFYHRRKQGKDVEQIDTFIKRLGHEEELKSQVLGTLLIEECGIDSQKVAAILADVTKAETKLFRRIIEMFLQRNPGMLHDIEQLISQVSDPYCKLLADIRNQKATDGTDGADEDAAYSELESRLAGIERINHQLIKQLTTAQQTIEEITEEYTRVFSGHQSALELENSSKRMLQIFQDAELKINHLHLDQPE